MALLPALVLLVLLAQPTVHAAGLAWAQDPAPRDPPGAIDAASALFEAGRWEEAAAAFEAAARGGVAVPLPSLRQWGIAASEAGRPLAAYVRLRQYLAVDPPPVDRDALVERVGRARDVLIAAASRFSRLSASLERRPDGDVPGERRLARAAARDGEVSVEALAGPRVEAPVWRRAEEVPLAPYLEFVRRFLDEPALAQDFPAQAFDPNDPGPRRAAALRLVIGDEEWRADALRGESYERLERAAETVLEFARGVPALVDPERKTEVAPARPERRTLQQGTPRKPAVKPGKPALTHEKPAPRPVKKRP
jgi:hypothetical protein